ncbi:hypothetical protein [Conexibacter sp. DBS9H8]|uniref:hypothetical protein n=1 Tax=Conexibacter sp. DBS9H8 TaxID=2937801 RepID=UPI0020107B44|nr:hypothetical protein [Conexibacter sp. DBS9H8]
MFSDDVVRTRRWSPLAMAWKLAGAPRAALAQALARLVAATAVILAVTPALAFAGGKPSGSSGSSIINPGQGVVPPGAAQLTTLVGYVAWAVFALCVVGVLMAAAQMAVAHHRGAGAGEHASRLGWVLAACVVAGSASALVGALA